MIRFNNETNDIHIAQTIESIAEKNGENVRADIDKSIKMAIPYIDKLIIMNFGLDAITDDHELFLDLPMREYMDIGLISSHSKKISPNNEATYSQLYNMIINNTCRQIAELVCIQYERESPADEAVYSMAAYRLSRGTMADSSSPDRLRLSDLPSFSDTSAPAENLLTEYEDSIRNIAGLFLEELETLHQLQHTYQTMFKASYSDLSDIIVSDEDDFTEEDLLDFFNGKYNEMDLALLSRFGKLKVPNILKRSIEKPLDFSLLRYLGSHKNDFKSFAAGQKILGACPYHVLGKNYLASLYQQSSKLSLYNDIIQILNMRESGMPAPTYNILYNYGPFTFLEDAPLSL